MIIYGAPAAYQNMGFGVEQFRCDLGPCANDVRRTECGFRVRWQRAMGLMFGGKGTCIHIY